MDNSVQKPPTSLASIYPMATNQGPTGPNEDKEEMPDFGPEPKDTIEPLVRPEVYRKYVDPENLPPEKRPPLKDKDLISEKGYKKKPQLLWIWLGVFFAAMLVLWGSYSFFGNYIDQFFKTSPFLQVSNRQMSLFLWQFPNYMRQNVAGKTNYLTGFSYEPRVGITEGYAENWVVAPPELLFLYHTWDRLLKKEFTPRPIPRSQFSEFLLSAPEWQPKNWPSAPEEYARFINEGRYLKMEDLSEAPISALPLDVRIAFQGWKNFYLEGNAINAFNITYKDLERFISKHKNYARNYWRNLFNEDYPDYLLQFSRGGYNQEETVPSAQLPSFIRVAIYNAQQAEKKN
jgi:hypothetical protein